MVHVNSRTPGGELAPRSTGETCQQACLGFLCSGNFGNGACLEIPEITWGGKVSTLPIRIRQTITWIILKKTNFWLDVRGKGLENATGPLLLCCWVNLDFVSSIMIAKGSVANLLSRFSLYNLGSSINSWGKRKSYWICGQEVFLSLFSITKYVDSLKSKLLLAPSWPLIPYFGVSRSPP